MRVSVSLLQHVETLVLTLERGWAGKGQYLAVLKHLGLTKSKRVVEIPNTFEYRATAKKVCSFSLASEFPLNAGNIWQPIVFDLVISISHLQVEHLLRIETQEQHRSRLATEAAKRMLRPPLVICHPPGSN